jgi:hypothetical protein
MCSPTYTAIRQTVRIKKLQTQKHRKHFCITAVKLTPADSINFFRMQAKRFT